MTIVDSEWVSLNLLGGTHVVSAGRQVPIPEGSKRLVAFVALNNRRVDRSHAAGVLWPETDRHRAAGNLRSAMWRLHCAGIHILHADSCSLSLHPRLRVDLEGVFDWANRLVSGRSEPPDLDFDRKAVRALDLFPGWYDDWVLLERERIRQVLLAAIEDLAGLLVKANRCGDAIEAALAAVSADPLRESTQRALIEAHLAEGNRCEALRSFATYEDLLSQELGVRPSVELTRTLHQHAQ